MACQICEFRINMLKISERGPKRGFPLGLDGVILTGFGVFLSELQLHNMILFGPIGPVDSPFMTYDIDGAVSNSLFDVPAAERISAPQ